MVDATHDSSPYSEGIERRVNAGQMCFSKMLIRLRNENLVSHRGIQSISVSSSKELLSMYVAGRVPGCGLHWNPGLWSQIPCGVRKTMADRKEPMPHLQDNSFVRGQKKWITNRNNLTRYLLPTKHSAQFCI